MRITTENAEALRDALDALIDAANGLVHALDIFEDAETSDERAAAQEVADNYILDLQTPLADLTRS